MKAIKFYQNKAERLRRYAGYLENLAKENETLRQENERRGKRIVEYEKILNSIEFKNKYQAQQMIERLGGYRGVVHDLCVLLKPVRDPKEIVAKVEQLKAELEEARGELGSTEHEMGKIQVGLKNDLEEARGWAGLYYRRWEREKESHRWTDMVLNESAHDTLKKMDSRHRELLKTMRKARTKRKKFRRRQARKTFANFKAMEAKLKQANEHNKEYVRLTEAEINVRDERIKELEDEEKRLRRDLEECWDKSLKDF